MALDEQVRVFVAIELPDDVRVALARIQDSLRDAPGGRAARWLATSSIHLTVKYLGEVSASSVSPIYDAVRSECEGRRPFEIRLAGLGCFPNVRRPRIVWVGVHEPSGQLSELQRDIESRLAQLGYPAEARRFSPHLTIGRGRRGASKAQVAALGRLIADSGAGEVARLTVDGVSVMRSDLLPSGAIYTQLARARLDSAWDGPLRAVTEG